MKQIAVIRLLSDLPANPDDLAIDVLHRFGFDGVCVQILEGADPRNQPGGPKPLRAYLDRLCELGYTVEAYGHHTEDQANRQGEVIEEARQKLGFSTYHLNLMDEWLKPYGMPRAFKALLGPMKEGGFELLVNSFRHPSKQGYFPWDAARLHEKIDGWSPLMYWALAHDPVEQLSRCLAEYAELNSEPVYPWGPLFGETFLDPATGEAEYWEPTLEELQAFRQYAQAAGLQRIYWYRLGWALKRSRYEMIAAATGIDRGATQPPTPPPPEPGATLEVSNCQYLNMRSVPDPFDPDNRVATLSAGLQVHDLGQVNGNWRYVRVLPFEGWMHGDFLEQVEESQEHG